LRNAIFICILILFSSILINSCKDTSNLDGPGDFIVFSKPNALSSDEASVNNHLRFSTDFEVLHKDDLSLNIYSCQVERTYLCIAGAFPIIVPKMTGTHKFNTLFDSYEVTILPPLSFKQTREERDEVSICNFSAFDMVVSSHEGGKFLYSFTRSRGLIRIERFHEKENEIWYLLKGEIFNYANIC